MDLTVRALDEANKFRQSGSKVFTPNPGRYALVGDTGTGKTSAAAEVLPVPVSPMRQNLPGLGVKTFEADWRKVFASSSALTVRSILYVLRAFAYSDFAETSNARFPPNSIS